jgi:DNA invertase Pin-like site-specific DNA recombinase
VESRKESGEFNREESEEEIREGIADKREERRGKGATELDSKEDKKAITSRITIISYIISLQKIASFFCF